MLTISNVVHNFEICTILKCAQYLEFTQHLKLAPVKMLFIGILYGMSIKRQSTLLKTLNSHFFNESYRATLQSVPLQVVGPFLIGFKISKSNLVLDMHDYVCAKEKFLVLTFLEFRSHNKKKT